MYSLRIREDGMRSPRWHPTTAEMGYAQSGSGRMPVMDPDIIPGPGCDSQTIRALFEIIEQSLKLANS